MHRYPKFVTPFVYGFVASVVLSLCRIPSAFAAGDLEKPSCLSTTTVPAGIDPACFAALCRFQEIYDDPLEVVASTPNSMPFHMMPNMALQAIHQIKLFVDLPRYPDFEIAWTKIHPLGVDPLTYQVPPAHLTEAEADRLKDAAKPIMFDLVAKNRRPGKYVDPENLRVATARMAAAFISTEGQFLAETQERIRGIRDVIFNLTRSGKKPDKLARLREELSELEKHNQELEMAILAKFAEFQNIEAITGAASPEEVQRIGSAAYRAGLSLAQRLGLKFQETTIEIQGKKYPALEFFEDDATEVGRLVIKVHNIGESDPLRGQRRAIFSPHAAKWNYAYVDRLGNFIVAPQFLLFGREDHLNTPLQLRMVQVVGMQNSGTPTPFRGNIVPLGDTSPTTLEIPMATDVAFRGLLRMAEQSDTHLKRYLAARSADAAFNARLSTAKAVAAAPGFQNLTARFTKSLAGGIDIHNGQWSVTNTGTGILFTPPPASNGGISGGIHLSELDKERPMIELTNGIVNIQFPANGRDLAPVLARLRKIPNSEKTTAIPVEAKEDLLRLLRGIQRSVDVAHGIISPLDEPLARIAESARNYLVDPTPENEAEWLQSMREMPKIPLNRLSLRSSTPKTKILSEPAEEEDPFAIKAMPTSSHLVNRLKSARGNGKQTGAYRSAMEEISVEAVRGVLEQQNLVTYNRTQDQMGYDVLVTDSQHQRKMHIEVKSSSDPNGTVVFYPTEVNFAHDHLDDADWMLAIVTIDDEGQATVHLRNGIDLGPPLPRKSANRPFLIQDLLRMGNAVNTPPMTEEGGRRIE